jgi:hypothetical protein
MGRVLAQETLGAVTGPGEIVVVCYRVTSSPDNSILAPADDAFLRDIRKSGRLTVASVVRDSYDPYAQDAGWAGTLMESSRFVQFVTEHRSASAIVIIGGTPQLNPADAARLPSPRPKIVTASVFMSPASRLMEEGIITAAVVTRSRSSEERTPPKTPQDWFDRRYEVWRAARTGVSP